MLSHVVVSIICFLHVNLNILRATHTFPMMHSVSETFLQLGSVVEIPSWTAQPPKHDHGRSDNQKWLVGIRDLLISR